MVWVAVGIVITLAVVVAMMVRNDDSFQVAATELGLKLTRTVPELLPRLDGMVDGVAVKLDIVAQRDPVLRYRAFYPALGMALRLERETTISRTLGQLGSGDQQVGAKPFDDSFRVNTSRPDALQTMMTPELRRVLVNLIDRHPQAVIADGEITITAENLDPASEVVVRTVREMVAAARLLTAARPPALEPPPVRSTPPPTATTPSPEPATDRETAPQPLPEVEPETEAPAPPPPPEPVPVAVVSTGLPDDFFENVFGANRLSFEDDGVFEREYRGREVALSGTIKHASPYRGDDELSDTAGTKAVITVAQIETDLYGKSDVDAVVFLGDVVPDDLARGNHIAFTGTIARVDPFMRNLFIVEASQTS